MITPELIQATLPNILPAVEGETPFAEKLNPFISDAEKWMAENFISKDLYEQLEDGGNQDEMVDTYQQLVILEAFRTAIPMLDLILTPNGFGVVSNTNIAPASKERVERLIETVTNNRDRRIKSLIRMLSAIPEWRQSTHGKFFAATMFPNIDITERIQESGDKWKMYLRIRDSLISMEQTFAKQYISDELIAVLREEEQTSTYRNYHHIHVCNLLRASEIKCIQAKDKYAAMAFEHEALIYIVDYIRKHPDVFPEWHSSPTAQLFDPPIFENNKNATGYWF